MTDSTGYKIFGEGEWKTYEHSRTKENQVAEIAIRAIILNIWTNEWMPKYTRTNKNKTKP